MVAKFDVDEKVFIVGKVIEINATDEGIIYKLKANTMNGAVLVNIEEDDLRVYTPENVASNSGNQNSQNTQNQNTNPVVDNSSNNNSEQNNEQNNEEPNNEEQNNENLDNGEPNTGE